MQPRIRKLKDFCLRTSITSGGKANAILVVPPRPAYAEAVREIQRFVQRAGGGALPVYPDDAVTDDVAQNHHVITLGNLTTNRLVQELYYQWYTNVDLGYPGLGGYVVRSIHDPWGTGRNVILLGGSDDAGVADATQAFLRSLPRARDLAVGWLTDIRLGRGLRQEMESRPQYRGPAVDGGMKYYFCSDERYGRIYRQALLDRARLPDPFECTHIWFWEPLVLWDLVEESPIFSDTDRLIITNLFLQYIESHEGWNFAGFRDDLRRGNLSQSHRTAPALSCFFGARYFRKYYGLKPAAAWLADARKYFHAQARSAKCMDETICSGETLGCGGIMTYAFASGDFEFFENGTARAACDVVAMTCNNLGFMAAYGDILAFSSAPSDFFCRAAHYYRDGRYEYLARIKNPYGGPAKPVWRQYDHALMAFHTDVAPREPTDLTGVKAAPLSRRFWDTYPALTIFPDHPKTIPFRRAFDKLSFRKGFAPEQHYLLLDGVAGGGHGHADVNSILEFTSNGRLFIVTGDFSYGYDNSGLAHHNAVTVLRNGEGELPPGFAGLEVLGDLPGAGFSRTLLRSHNGTDWYRNIIWQPERYFCVIDELRVRKAGDYLLDCRWRTLGKPALRGSDFVVTQKRLDGKDRGEVALHIQNDGQARLRFERDAFRGSYFTRTVQKKYEYAEPVLNILTQTLSGSYRPGETIRFANLIYTSPSSAPRNFRMERTAESGCIIWNGRESEILGAGAGPQVEAALWWVGARAFALCEATRLGTFFRSNRPVSIECHLDDRRAVVVAGAPTRIRLGSREVIIPSGRHELRMESAAPPPDFRSLFQAPAARRTAARRRLAGPRETRMAKGGVLRPSWRRQLSGDIRDIAIGDLNRDGAPEILLALSSGRIAALNAGGRTLWQQRAGGPVHSVAMGDIDGDGHPEVVAGTENAFVHALDAAGKPRWRRRMPQLSPKNIWALPEAEVVRVLCADLDADGREEILAGVGDLYLHVLSGVPRKPSEAMEWGRYVPNKVTVKAECGQERWRRFAWGTWNTFTCRDLDGDGKLEIVGGPGRPPKAAASPGWILRADGEILAELNLDGWAGGLNALQIFDWPQNHPVIAIGTMKGYVRLYRVPRRLGERLKLKPGTTVLDHTSGQNRSFIFRPLHLLGERNLGDLITGLALLAAGSHAPIIVAGATTGYVTAFETGGRKRWTRNLGSAVTVMRAISLGGSEIDRVAVGCKSGRLALLDRHGAITASAELKRPVTGLAVISGVDRTTALLLAIKEGGLLHFRQGLS